MFLAETTKPQIFRLGDQNQDGFDDIMLIDCNDKRGYVYFGGSPMDTIPEFSIPLVDGLYKVVSIGIIDLNDDGINDIFSTFAKSSYTPWKVYIYYGGSIIDTVPNLIFGTPPGATGLTSPLVIKDFNGDGRNELLLYDAFLPYSQKQYGAYYFYNTEVQFDTIAHYSIVGDSVNKVRLGALTSSGDLNGDGKGDFTIGGYKTEGSINRWFRQFYIGNENFELEPAETYYNDEHSFDVRWFRIMNDINGDGKDDIIIFDYGFYPYYYHNAILKGSSPLDTIPDYGLNTQNQGISTEIFYSLGDVNGDGFNDFFAQALNFGYRNVKLWVGGRDMPYTSSDQANKTWYGDNSGFGRIISDIGDLDGDSVNDLVIGELNLYTGECKLGRIYIFRGDTSVIGDTGVVSVNDLEINPSDYELKDPYPNPFNPSTVISWRSPSRSVVKIKMYDLLGREITILLNEEKEAGRYKIEFNADKYNLSSGVYIIQLEAYYKGGIIYKVSKKISYIK